MLDLKEIVCTGDTLFRNERLMLDKMTYQDILYFWNKKKPCSIFHYPKKWQFSKCFNQYKFLISEEWQISRGKWHYSPLFQGFFSPFILTKCPIRMQSAFFRTWFDSSLVLRTFHFTPTNIQIFLSLGGKWHCVIIGIKLIKVARVGIVL